MSQAKIQTNQAKKSFPHYYGDSIWWRVVRLSCVEEQIAMLADMLFQRKFLHGATRHHGLIVAEHFGNSIAYLLSNMKKKEDAESIIQTIGHLEVSGTEAMRVLNGCLPIKKQIHRDIFREMGDWT